MPDAPLVQAMLAAYREGYFPMADPDRPGDLHWFNPDPRGVIPLSEAEGLHIPRSLRKKARSGRFRITADTAFEQVMRGCAAPRPSEPDSWIDDRMTFSDNAPPGMKASMLHDLEAGNRLELDWLTGKIVALGKELGVPTPRSEAVYAAVKLHRMGAAKV